MRQIHAHTPAAHEAAANRNQHRIDSEIRVPDSTTNVRILASIASALVTTMLLGSVVIGMIATA